MNNMWKINGRMISYPLYLNKTEIENIKKCNNIKIDNSFIYKELQKYRDFYKNKTIIDFGCNIGTYSLFFASNGAKHVIGIDKDQSVINIAEMCRKRMNMNNVTFICEDILIDDKIYKSDVSVMLKGIFLADDTHIYKLEYVKKFINRIDSKYFLFSYYNSVYLQFRNDLKYFYKTEKMNEDIDGELDFRVILYTKKTKQ